MLWPGSLIAATDRIPDSGVFIYAMMAAGGDIGASVGPQLAGIMADVAGIRYGILIGMIFPLCGIFVNCLLHRQKKL